MNPRANLATRPVGSIAACPAMTGGAQVTPQQLQACLQQAINDGAPGLSAAIANRSGVIWSGAAGWADIADRRPVDESSLFGIGSITKMFVAVVVLQLVNEGRLKLGDTPAQLLGSSAMQGIANADSTTIADLLGHRSGIPSWEDDRQWIRHARGEALDPVRRWCKAEPIDYIRGTPALAPSGQRFAYSNSGYTLLGLMIEAVTGNTAEAEIRRRIITSAGLADTYLEGFEPGPGDRVARGYHFLTPQYRAIAGVAPSFEEIRPGLLDTGATNLSAEWTAGGLISSARDLVLFARALRDGHLLDPHALALMQHWGPGFVGKEAGNGIFRIKTGANVVIGHTGSVLGFTAVLWWSESSDAIFAVLSNGSGIHAGRTPAEAISTGLEPGLAASAIQFCAQHYHTVNKYEL